VVAGFYPLQYVAEQVGGDRVKPRARAASDDADAEPPDVVLAAANREQR
jgi:ABC-type Zn uptake system ZnuABC Zn-binding protein ZnuA